MELIYRAADIPVFGGGVDIPCRRYAGVWRRREVCAAGIPSSGVQRVKHTSGCVDIIFNKQTTHLHFFHSNVLFKVQLGLYEGLAFLPRLGREKLHLGLYAARLICDHIWFLYIYICIYI